MKHVSIALALFALAACDDGGNNDDSDEREEVRDTANEGANDVADCVKACTDTAADCARTGGDKCDEDFDGCEAECDQVGK